jgi:ankyrin repeat protein
MIYLLFNYQASHKFIQPNHPAMASFPINVSDIQAINKFIESGHDVNGMYGLGGETLLHTASLCGLFDSVKHLVLECGADVNKKDYVGFTPLHEAARQMGFPPVRVTPHDTVCATPHDIIMFLLENGADHTCVNFNGETVADIVDRHHDGELAEYIRSYELIPTKGVYL